MNNRISISDIKALKGKRKITMLTAYDYPVAALIDKAGIDMILVGDSLANVALGLESTKLVGMNEMLHHAKAVTRAVRRALVIGDMPFEAYQKDVRQAGRQAQRFIHDAGCNAVKVEWFDHCESVIIDIVDEKIAVMGHIGLTPQTADKLGGFKVQGKDRASAAALLTQALRLQNLGCFAVVLECVPDRVASRITRALTIPTIGIGAGPGCDGQVLVTHDMLGLFDRYSPKFVKRYADAGKVIADAAASFRNDVEHGGFPASEHSFTISDAEYEKFLQETGDR